MVGSASQCVTHVVEPHLLCWGLPVPNEDSGKDCGFDLSFPSDPVIRC